MQRSEAVDWLKAVGISLIVYGHVGASSTLPWTPPIYVKQLGVAFFVFATGFTLARERRAVVEALITRLFPVYLFGLAVAGLITTAGLLSGGGTTSGTGLALSNYLPFVGGANVVFNHFPANPTTWYVGTYLHILVVWALWLRRERVGLRLVLGALLLEIPIRAGLIAWAGPYVAYMLLTNWMTVFLLGMLWGSRTTSVTHGGASSYIAALAGGLVASAIGWGFMNPEATFPFMTLKGVPQTAGVFLVSTAVSILYVFATLLAFAAAQRLNSPRPVKFLARNSLLVFLAHMPVYFTLHPLLLSTQLTYAWRTLILFVVCLLVLSLGSELVTRVINPKRLGDALTRMLIGVRPTNPTTEAMGA